MRDPKLTFLIRCAYGAVWLALIWLMVRYVLVWLLPFLIALALAALLEPAVVLCRRRLHLRRGFTATVLSLVVLGTVAAGLVLLAMVLLRQVCELSGRLPGYLEALPRWTELVRGRAQQLCAACPEGLRSWLEALLDGLSAQLAELLESMGQRCLRAVTAAAAALPASATLSPLAAEVNGAVKNSSAPSAIMQTSALAALRALVPPQTPRTTATCGTTPETFAICAFSFALTVSTSRPSVSFAPTEL